MGELDKIIDNIGATFKKIIDVEYFNFKFVAREQIKITDVKTPNDECAIELRRLLQQVYIAYLFVFRVIDSHVPKNSVIHSPEHARIFLIAKNVFKLKAEYSSFMINQIDDDFEFTNSHEHFYLHHLVLKFFCTRALAREFKVMFTENDYGQLVDFNLEKFKIFIKQPFHILSQLKLLITRLDKEIFGLEINYPLEPDHIKAAVFLYQDVHRSTTVNSFIKPDLAKDMSIAKLQDNSPEAASRVGMTVQYFLISQIFIYQCFKAETERFLATYGMRAPELATEILNMLKVHKSFLKFNIKDFNGESLVHDKQQANIIKEHVDFERLGLLVSNISESTQNDLAGFRSINIGRILNTLADISLLVHALYYIDSCLAQQKHCYKDSTLMASIAATEKVTDNIAKMQQQKRSIKASTPTNSPTSVSKTKEEKSEPVSASDNSSLYITPASSPVPELLPGIKDEPAQEPLPEEKPGDSNDSLKEKAALLAICNKQYEFLKIKKSEYDHEVKKLSKLLSACTNRKKKSNLKSSAAEKTKKLEQRFKDLGAKLDSVKLGNPSYTVEKLGAFKHDVNSLLNNIETYFIKPIMELQGAAAKSSTPNATQQNSKIKQEQLQKEKLQNALMREIVRAGKERFSRIKSTLASPQSLPTSININDLQRNVSASSQLLSQDSSTDYVTSSWEDLAGPTPVTSPELMAEKKTDTIEIGIVSLSSGSEAPAAHLNRTFSLTINFEADSETSDISTSPIVVQAEHATFPDIQSPEVTSPEPSATGEEITPAVEAMEFLSTLTALSQNQHTNDLVASLETGSAVPEIKPDLNEYPSDPEDLIAEMIAREAEDRAEKIRRQELDRIFASKHVPNPVIQSKVPQRVVPDRSTLSLEEKIIRPPARTYIPQQFFPAQPMPVSRQGREIPQSDLNVRAKEFRPKGFY